MAVETNEANQDIIKLIEENEALNNYIKQKTEAEIAEAIKVAKNTPEEVGKWKSIGKAEAYKDAQKKVLNKFGLTKEEIKDFEDDFEKIVDLGLSKIVSTKDVTAQELQKELMSIRSEYDNYKNEEVPKIKTQYEIEFNKKVAQTETTKILAKHQNDLFGKFDAVNRLMQNEFDEIYNISFIDGKLAPRTKKDNLLPIVNGKTTEDMEEIILDWIKKNELYRQSNGQAGTQGQQAQNNEPKYSEAALEKGRRMGLI